MLSTLGVYKEDVQSSVLNFGYMYCTYTYVVSTLGGKKQEPISNKKKANVLVHVKCSVESAGLTLK